MKSIGRLLFVTVPLLTGLAESRAGYVYEVTSHDGIRRLPTTFISAAEKPLSSSPVWSN